MTAKYDLVKHPDEFHQDHWCVSIQDGPLEGVVYQYDTVNFSSETEDSEEMYIKFNTITVDNPSNADLTTEESVGIMGDILVHLISENLKEVESNNEQNRTNDT